eukprot:452775_1
MPYYSSLDSLQQYGQQNNLEEIKSASDEVKQCASLSNWIYDAKKELTGFDGYNYKKIVIANKSTQVAQWVFLQSNITKTAFLVFKGTDINNPQDVIADLGIIPSPLYVANDGEIEISGHGLMEVSIRRDYQRIANEIKSKLKFIDKLYITGHSLGGGLSIIFGIRAIIEGLFPLQNNKKVKIITFAAPNVIAIENDDLDKLSSESKQYLDILCNITHIYVNRFDIVPRLLSSSGIKWIEFISEFVCKYIGDWKQYIMGECHKYMLTQNMENSKSVMNILNQLKADTIGVAGQSLISMGKTVHESLEITKNICVKSQSFGSVLNEKMIEFVNDEYKYGTEYSQQQDDDQNIIGTIQNIFESVKKNSKNNLSLYHPFGTYYFYTSQCEPCIASKYQNESKKILSYIPSRLSYNVESMKMLLSNHSMSEYRRLFRNCKQMKNDKNNPEWFVSGYMQQIKFGILNGVKCGSGAAFWIKRRSKETSIGTYYAQQHIAEFMDNDRLRKIREEAYWSTSRNFKYRIVFHIWGDPNYYRIAAANDMNAINKIFNRL